MSEEDMHWSNLDVNAIALFEGPNSVALFPLCTNWTSLEVSLISDRP